MIVYQSDKAGFLEDVLSNNISDIIHNAYYAKLGRYTSKNEVLAWQNSMMYMNSILSDDEIPKDAKVSIEFQIPLTSKRIDFIIAGNNHENKEHVIIIELKQWSKASITNEDAIIKTYFQHGEAKTAHPSYQAWSYASMIQNFNSTVQEEGINLVPCAYLHNYTPDNIITNPFYSEHIQKAPIFLKPDAIKLREFIKKFIKYGDQKDILYRIENGRFRPTKQLADSLASMLEGNEEFVMIDDQKVVFESAMAMARKAKPDKKQVLIVEGGPGTGKSVVAINLLVKLTTEGLLAKYISKNAAPREVYSAMLTGTKNKTAINNLFGGTGAFIDVESDIFDALIVDEAHRLNHKSGLYQNLGENQILEIINASKFSIFFVDDNQQIHIKDIGDKAYIEKLAKSEGAVVKTLSLQSQFRCNGSDAYLSWIDNTIQIRETANIKLTENDFEFKVFDDPNELRKAIVQKNKTNNKSRLVAGYCWDWNSKKNESENDIIIPKHKFAMKWNLQNDGSTWIIGKNSVNEIGCIHTCQGLELDYVGVIIGDDMRFDTSKNKIVTDVLKRSSNDRSIMGIKKQLKEDKNNALKIADKIIKNTYRTLMTRGMKGCYIYCCDKALSNHFSSLLESSNVEKGKIIQMPLAERIEADVNDDVKYVDYLPLYSLKAACGKFSEWQPVEEEGWIKVEGFGKLERNMYIVRAKGHSMLPKIKDGDLCVFRGSVKGSRQNKIVLVQHNQYYDSVYEGSYSIKKYSSEKVFDKITGEWKHEQIILKPLNNEYENIIIKEEDGFVVVGEFIGLV